jgi:hypothetical protein
MFISITGTAQWYNSRDYSPHDGFNFSVFAGAAGGKIKGEFGDSTQFAVKGSTLNFCLHLGYSINNWAMGLAITPQRMLVNSTTLNGRLNPDNKIQYMDHTTTGLYLTRYFMWINIFVTLEGGLSSLNVLYSDYTMSSQTQIGFAWNFRVGKEFILGKRKKAGLGFYANLGGLKCYDQAPFNKNYYNYLGPGAGLAFSFH